jgi:hypothetical protein
MPSSSTITIAELLEIPAGEKGAPQYVNAEFVAVVSHCKAPAGRMPGQATLTDPDTGITIVGKFFGRDPGRYEGQTVRFSGSGMTRTAYNGTEQVTIGDKATINVERAPAPAAARPATPPPAAHAPAAQSQLSPATPAAPAVFGATVGMALNNACTIIRDDYLADFTAPQRVNYYKGPEFSRDLWQLASDIIRISRMLEAGKLADAPKVRADPEAAARAAQERANAEHAAAEAAKAAQEEAERRARAAKAATSAPDNVDPSIDPSDVPY